MRKIGNVLATLVMITASSLAVADPASAATPTCTRTVGWTLADGETGFPVPASSSGSINCNLVQGDNSDAVADLQQVINGCYRTPGTEIAVDGDFGPKTKAALRALQRAAGTPDDGEYGPHTRHAMLWGGGAWNGCFHLSPNP